MKRLLIALIATIPLSACAYEGGYGGGYAAGYGTPVAYDGFYDDYYGPIYDGYWDGDSFYYRGSEHGRYVRDTHGHFRHDIGRAPNGGFGNPNNAPAGAQGGFHPMHGMGPAGGHGHAHH